VLPWRGIARVAHGGGHRPQPTQAFRAGNQAFGDRRTEADAVTVDLAPLPIGAGRVLSPDDRVGLVGDRVARPKQPDEEINVRAAACGRRRTQCEIETADLAADVGEHDEPRPGSEAGRRVHEEGLTLAGVRTTVCPSLRTLAGQLGSESHRVVELR
jgi:hypothetical protein